MGGHLRAKSSVLRTSARGDCAHHEMRNMLLEHIKSSFESEIRGTRIAMWAMQVRRRSGGKSSG